MNIYEMELHDTVQVANFSITRVAGGWIYQSTSDGDAGNGWRVSSVFVPYDNEFQNKGKQT